MPQYVADYGVEEAKGLAEALNAQIVDAFIVPLREIRAGEYFGKGKVEEVRAQIKGEDVNLVIVNAAISPVQQRNLEEKWNCKVIDRTGLILRDFRPKGGD